MKHKTKAAICYAAALIYTFGGVFLLKAVFGDALTTLPGWLSVGLYLLFMLPVLALVVYGYGQWLKGSVRSGRPN